MICIAYLVDGPLHGQHVALPDPMPRWTVVKPWGSHDMLLRSPQDGDRSPEVADTLTTGEYERAAKPVLIHPQVIVWRYTWKGWL